MWFLLRFHHENVSFLMQNLYGRRGSCVVPYGACCDSTTQTYFSLSETFIDGVVPGWFPVFPTGDHARMHMFFPGKTFMDGVVPTAVHATENIA